MNQKMYQKYCDDASCGFVVKSKEKGEVVKLIKMHAKHAHNLDVSEEEISPKVEELA